MWRARVGAESAAGWGASIRRTVSGGHLPPCLGGSAVVRERRQATHEAPVSEVLTGALCRL